jgi:hypothetical protein
MINASHKHTTPQQACSRTSNCFSDSNVESKTLKKMRLAIDSDITQKIRHSSMIRLVWFAPDVWQSIQKIISKMINPLVVVRNGKINLYSNRCAIHPQATIIILLAKVNHWSMINTRRNFFHWSCKFFMYICMTSSVSASSLSNFQFRTKSGYQNHRLLKIDP